MAQAILSLMSPNSLAGRLSDLASNAEYLANTIYLDEDVPDERTRHLSHRLRETLGVALVLSERLARENGNDSMVTLSDQGDGPQEARFAVAFDETEITDLEMQ